MDKIKTAYKSSENIYDNVLTQSKWWSKLYISLFWGVDDNEIARTVLGFIPKDFTGRLLDVPVGTGVFTAETYKELTKADIICVDYSEAMLNKAKMIFLELGLTHVRCQQGDVGKLDFPDEYFNIVLSMNGFHAFPDKIKAFDETARVLKHGGLFIGCFYIKGGYIPSDIIVNKVLSKKGWFTPPFHTLYETEKILKHHYAIVELFTSKAMVWFKCIK
ncbi:MAG: class I SAM-dependent methyltransferase [Prolixibacteraceae bacterium]|nr:class I SAM-dependent methyltransferase [Prolixibacteraceae bacterium]